MLCNVHYLAKSATWVTPIVLFTCPP